jgi:hypothetical protein
MGKRKILHNLEHQDADKRSESVFYEQAEPIAGKSVSYPQYSGRDVAQMWSVRVAGQRERGLASKKDEPKDGERMAMDGRSGSVPPVGRRCTQRRIAVQTGGQRRGHVATDAAQDTDGNAAEDPNRERHDEGLRCAVPQDFKEFIGGQLRGPFWRQV